MNNQKITINQVEFDKVEIINLLNQKKKNEVVKLIVDKAKIGLNEAIALVDTIQFEYYESLFKEGEIIRNEKVQCHRDGDDITITYFDKDKNASILTPTDPLWGTVKKMLENHPMLKEYEEAFNKEIGQEKPSAKKQNPHLIKDEKKPFAKVLIFVFVFLLLALIYFYIQK